MKTYLIGSSKNFLEKIQNVLTEASIHDTHVFIAKDVTAQELKENTSDCEILVASPTAFKNLTKEHMESMPNLKFISTSSVGTDWVDLKAAKELGIIVSNEKGVNSEAVAEHCFGMILDLTKRITEADRDIHALKHREISEYMGINIYQKTIGIIGLGDIGQRVARIAKGFEMRILGLNKSRKSIAGVEVVDLERLLKESDVIVITVPYTTETENLLSKKEFTLMKKGIILVSISREKVIDKNSVLEAIATGTIAGFGFDAEIGIPIPADDPYLKSPRIVVTPHTASVTQESDKAYAIMTGENISAFLASKPIRVVN